MDHVVDLLLYIVPFQKVDTTTILFAFFHHYLDFVLSRSFLLFEEIVEKDSDFVFFFRTEAVSRGCFGFLNLLNLYALCF